MKETKEIQKQRNKIKGTVGEIQAVDFLKKKKFKILETNYINDFGEIDIIAKDKKVVVFVEVKQRATLAFGRPIEAIDERKQNKLKRIAEIYLMLNNIYFDEVRFDVIEILDQELIYVKNAF